MDAGRVALASSSKERVSLDRRGKPTGWIPQRICRPEPGKCSEEDVCDFLYVIADYIPVLYLSLSFLYTYGTPQKSNTFKMGGGYQHTGI